MNTQKETKRSAALIGGFLLILSAVSLWYILAPREKTSDYIAELYQDGELIASIPLSEIQEPRRFTVTNHAGNENEVEIRPDSIGIVSADCPDRLCVQQGFLYAPGLPVTCLPNRLVIRLRPATPNAEDSETVDIITH